MSEENILVTSSYDHTIKFWTTTKSNWECSKSLVDNSQIVNRMSISPNKKNLLCGCSSSLKLYDLSDRDDIRLKHTIGYPCNVTSVGFKRDSEWCFAAAEDGSVKIHDLRLANAQNVMKRSCSVNTVVLSPDQANIIAGDQDGFIVIYDLVAGKIQSQFRPEGPDAAIRWITVSYKPTYLVAATSVGGCWIAKYDDSNTVLSETQHLDAHDDYITHANISPDCKHMATCSADKTVKLWDIEDDGTFLENKILYGHTSWVWESAFLCDSSHILTVSTDKFLKVWRGSDGHLIKNSCQHTKGVICMALFDTNPNEER
jgi:G protein beta subunit-like protein